MRSRSRLAELLAIFALLVGSLSSTAAAGETRESLPLGLGELERYRLSNGLRVVLNPSSAHPSVAVSVTYRAGSREESEGATGAAHLVERLMFQGSRNVEPGAHVRLIEGRGGHVRSSVTEDSASYCTHIPSGELELILWLESERMFRLAATRQAFTSHRAVLEDELRAHSSDPNSRGAQRLSELVFQRYWPYEHPPVGFTRDVQGLSYPAVRQFQQDYYLPERATLTIAGEFDVARAKAWVDQYFGTTARDAPWEETFDQQDLAAKLPRQTSERLSVLESPELKSPEVHYGWRIPGARTPDHLALELAALVLTNGETSRLNEQLVHGDPLARSVRASVDGLADADVFRVVVELPRRSTVDAMQKALEKTLTTLAVTGPTPAELDKAKASLRVSLLQNMETAEGRACELGKLEAVYGDATLLRERLTAYEDVTPARVRSAVARYLVETHRSIVEVYPPGWVRDVGPPIITASYVVKPGDNLTRIAQWHGTTPEAIAKQNGFPLSRRIVVGQRLLITANPSKIVKPVTHTVAKGDTLIGIGKKYGVDAADIAKRNGLNTKKAIRPGQVLQIPPRPKKDARSDAEPKGQVRESTTRGSGKESARKSPQKDSVEPAAKRAEAKTPAPKPARTYVVKAGDSLSVIAARHKVSVAALTRANGISKKKPIRPGQKLVIPEAN